MPKQISFRGSLCPVEHALVALLAVVAKRDLELYQLDVKTAFLERKLEKDIYMPVA